MAGRIRNNTVDRWLFNNVLRVVGTPGRADAVDICEGLADGTLASAFMPLPTRPNSDATMAGETSALPAPLPRRSPPRDVRRSVPTRPRPPSRSMPSSFRLPRALDRPQTIERWRWSGGANIETRVPSMTVRLSRHSVRISDIEGDAEKLRQRHRPKRYVGSTQAGERQFVEVAFITRFKMDSALEKPIDVNFLTHVY